MTMGRSNLPKQELPQDPTLLLKRFEDIARLAQPAVLSGLIRLPTR